MRRFLALTAILSLIFIGGTPALGGGEQIGEVLVLENALAKIDEVAVDLLELAKSQVKAGRIDDARLTMERLGAILDAREGVADLLADARKSARAAEARPAVRAPVRPAAAGFGRRRPVARGPAVAVPGWFSGRGGHRNLKANGGGAATEAAVNLGLDWLAKHQSPKGFWDCDDFTAQCKLNSCHGAGYALYDPGVTGLALLAFLGAGETSESGRYRQTLANGLTYLLRIQDPEGCFGPRTTNHFTYNHAIAAQAMAEAYALTKSPHFKGSAQRAADFCQSAQNPYLAWRYGVRPGDNDTSVTGWMVAALFAAKQAGLRVGPEPFDGAKAWIDKVTEPEYGRVGYTSRGTSPARPQDLMDKFPSDKSESLTAVGVTIRILTGESPRKSEMIQKGMDLCLKMLPDWDEQAGSIDLYYWYWGTQAAFQVGGDVWKRWNAAMRPALIDHQRKDGDEAGSWDPLSVWGRDGGRIYSTALSTMILQAYYRSGEDRRVAVPLSGEGRSPLLA